MTEEKRTEILDSLGIPPEYRDLYFYILYEDKIYLPEKYKKAVIKDRRFPIDNIKLRKGRTELILLLARKLLETNGGGLE